MMCECQGCELFPLGCESPDCLTGEENVATNYHISWLELAIQKLKESEETSSVNGDMTIEEFLQKYIGDELDSVIKLE